MIAAYDAPFPDDSFKAGAAHLPDARADLADDPASADNEAAWEVLARFERPFLLAFSDQRPDHRGRRRAVPRQGAGRRRASRTRPSRAAATSSRRTGGQELAQVILDAIDRG